MTMTALIADDEPQLALHLQNKLALLWPELEIVEVVDNGIDAARAIARLQPSLAFLDIQMPGLTGLEVAQGIEGPTKVVFVTAYDAHAVQAFEHAALDYVLKPVSHERLARTLARIKAAHKPARLRFLRAGVGDVTMHIAVDDVWYFHADVKYTVLRTAGGEYLIRTPLSDLAAQLDPALFWQIHRSTLINLAFLESTRRDETGRLYVKMKNHPREFPVSRAFVHLFRAM